MSHIFLNQNQKKEYDVISFFQNPYDYSHLHPNILDSDFYEIGKFLSLLFQNDRNKNLFMKKNLREIGFVHSGRNCVQSENIDKCVYMILLTEKNTIDKMINDSVWRNGESGYGEYEYIRKYYDTMLKLYLNHMQLYLYEHSHRRFVLPIHKKMFSFRGYHNGTVLSEVNKITYEVNENFDIDGQRWGNLEIFVFQIDGFVNPKKVTFTSQLLEAEIVLL